MSPRRVLGAHYGALRRRRDLRRSRIGLSWRTSVVDGYPRTAERPGSHYHAVSGAGPLGCDQQDQSRNPALARSALSKCARTRDDLRARILSAGRQKIDAVIFEALFTQRYAPRSWVIAPEDLDWLLVDLDTSPHLPVAPRHALRKRRRASRVEMLSQEVVEWPDPRNKKRKRTRTTRYKRL